MNVLEWIATLEEPRRTDWANIWANHTAGARSPDFDKIWEEYRVANNIPPQE